MGNKYRVKGGNFIGERWKFETDDSKKGKMARTKIAQTLRMGTSQS